MDAVAKGPMSLKALLSDCCTLLSNLSKRILRSVEQSLSSIGYNSSVEHSLLSILLKKALLSVMLKKAQDSVEKLC